ncbi:hypothetical protein I3J27_35165 [Bradyrhizobium xenonodulans]|uniref:Uncharacterized protein n=1 Tax=Bradyrhizobium xenonodulans TaxID=2736875 RepID=A0ABY7MKM8_9BRAD|nr:hypothetical protein [Bradyrhizobium xenonodulans]WBL78129.1 hypothetical protein I3J27_35165 [Bradyrhizobium xenonodulans]
MIQAQPGFPSRKFDPATEKPSPAFSANSRSGKFLRGAIEAAGLPDTVSISFDNVIPRALFDKQGRERYPTCAELVEELEHHALWKFGCGDRAEFGGRGSLGADVGTPGWPPGSSRGPK